MLSHKKIIILHVFIISALLSSALSCTKSGWNKKYSRSGPKILIEPSKTVKTHQEVLVTAEMKNNSTQFPSQTYAWNFGDHEIIDGVGLVSATHFYTKPGTYKISLTTTFPNGSTDTTYESITVIGADEKLAPRVATSPILELKFEASNPLGDTSGNGLNATWGSTGTGEFAPGIEGNALYLKDNKYLKVIDSSGILSGLDKYTISFWYKHETHRENSMFLQKYNSSQQKTAFSIGRHDTERIRTYLTTNLDSKTSGYWEIFDTYWHHMTIVYDSTLPDDSTVENANLKIYVDGVLMIKQENNDDPSPVNMHGTMITSNEPLYIGAAHDNTQFMNGYIDEIKIYNTALTVEEIHRGFELLHANIHARTGQYIIVKIPGDITAKSQNKITAKITGGNLTSPIVLNDSSDVLTLTTNAGIDNLKSEEKILFKNRNLAGSNNLYTLSVQLLKSSGVLIEERTIEFYKTYNGIPSVGIDENNSLRLKISGYPEGKLFFPVTPYGLNDEDVLDWQANDYINCLHTQGFYPQGISISDWERYINISSNLKAIGPGAWEGLGNPTEQRSTNYYILEEYVNTFKDHANMLSWHWMDEPELFDVSPAAIRSWTYRTHRIDSQHPVSINFVGPSWTEEVTTFGYNRRNLYQYKHNSKIFGQKTHPLKGTFVTDIYGFDYYPLEWLISKEASFSKLAYALDNIRDENYNLVPYFSFVETCDVSDEDPVTSPWAPSPEQLKMMIWINVVHGAKGINWFPYFTTTPGANYNVMQTFTTQITDLTDEVLCADSTRTLDVTNTGTARIDTMMKEDSDNIYIFAVRVSEVLTTGSPYLDPVDATTANNVTFTISGTVPNNTITPYSEGAGENITITGGNTLQDNFAPFDVHIYIIPKS